MGNEKVLSAVVDLKASNDKILSALVDLKAAVVSITRLQALHWAITHTKTSKANETIGNFKYILEYPSRYHNMITPIDSKDLILKILLSFVQDLVAGYSGSLKPGQYGRYNITDVDDAEKAAASTQFKKELADQIKMLTGLGTKFVPQSDGRLGIFLEQWHLTFFEALRSLVPEWHTIIPPF